MSITSSVFSERMIALWLRMDAARKQGDAVALQANKAVSAAVDACKLAVQGGRLYSDDKLETLTDAVNEAILAAIPRALDAADCLLLVGREARALRDWVDDGQTAEKKVANELAARAEGLVDQLRAFIHKYASCGQGLRVDDNTARRLATLWKGELPATLAQTFDGVTRRGLAA